MVRWNRKVDLKIVAGLKFDPEPQVSKVPKRMFGPRHLTAVCQLNSSNDKAANFSMCRTMITSASRLGAKMVFLPEAFDFIGQNKKETLELAETLEGDTISKFKDLARSNNAWLSLGGFHERISDSRIANTHLIINDAGEIVQKYRKVHLFDVNIPDKGVQLQESKLVERGNEIVPPVKTPFGNIGLCICYDLRFPEMGMMQKKMGAEILTYPSAFTYATGSLHWKSLLQTRAIENQVYVIAAAQCGIHNSKRTSWGHSMVVDPNGAIISQCSDGASFCLALIDLSIIDGLSQEMPVWDHRRYDLYPTLLPFDKTRTEDIGSSQKFYQFGQVEINSDAIFHKTHLTMAFTNKRCVVPGHVLVAPLRVVTRFRDLTSNELADLMQVVQKVESVMEKVVGCSSSTLSIQDGPYAGQTIEHVHVHVLPRKPGDFKRNDDIYYALEKHDKFAAIPERTQEEMAEEATMLKQYFK